MTSETHHHTQQPAVPSQPAAPSGSLNRAP